MVARPESNKTPAFTRIFDKRSPTIPKAPVLRTEQRALQRGRSPEKMGDHRRSSSRDHDDDDDYDDERDLYGFSDDERNDELNTPRPRVPSSSGPSSNRPSAHESSRYEPVPPSLRPSQGTFGRQSQSASAGASRSTAAPTGNSRYSELWRSREHQESGQVQRPPPNVFAMPPGPERDGLMQEFWRLLAEHDRQERQIPPQEVSDLWRRDQSSNRRSTDTEDIFSYRNLPNTDRRRDSLSGPSSFQRFAPNSSGVPPLSAPPSGPPNYASRRHNSAVNPWAADYLNPPDAQLPPPPASRAAPHRDNSRPDAGFASHMHRRRFSSDVGRDGRLIPMHLPPRASRSPTPDFSACRLDRYPSDENRDWPGEYGTEVTRNSCRDQVDRQGLQSHNYTGVGNQHRGTINPGSSPLTDYSSYRSRSSVSSNGSHTEEDHRRRSGTGGDDRGNLHGDAKRGSRRHSDASDLSRHSGRSGRERHEEDTIPEDPEEERAEWTPKPKRKNKKRGIRSKNKKKQEESDDELPQEDADYCGPKTPFGGRRRKDDDDDNSGGRHRDYSNNYAPPSGKDRGYYEKNYESRNNNRRTRQYSSQTYYAMNVSTPATNICSKTDKPGSPCSKPSHVHNVLNVMLTFLLASTLKASAAWFIPQNGRFEQILPREQLERSYNWHKEEGKIPCGFGERAKFNQGGYRCGV